MNHSWSAGCIVEGSPAENISDRCDVKHVFLRSKQVDRESLILKT